MNHICNLILYIDGNYPNTQNTLSPESDTWNIWC